MTLLELHMANKTLSGLGPPVTDWGSIRRKERSHRLLELGTTPVCLPRYLRQVRAGRQDETHGEENEAEFRPGQFGWA